MVRIEKMLVTWMDHRKRQGLNVTFDEAKKKAMECYNHPKKKETGPAPEVNASMSWFYKFKTHYGFHNISAWERLRALTRTPLLPTRIVSGPSLRKGERVQAPANF